VAVEVIGDVHRREGERWVPTAATTETTVDLDGVPVRVSWLEEGHWPTSVAGGWIGRPNACPTATPTACWRCCGERKQQGCCE